MRPTIAVLACAALLSTAGSAQAADPWKALQRPLELPTVDPGTPCPVSTVDPRVDWRAVNAFGDGIGRGPVYPGMSEDATITLRPVGGAWLRTKVFWYVKPSYRGRVLIRGRRLDARGSLRFGDQRLSKQLRIRPGQTVEWAGRPEGSRGVPSAVRALSGGCYGVQMDGTSFSRTVVFNVMTTTARAASWPARRRPAGARPATAPSARPDPWPGGARRA
jgi:hypothetical protein